MQNGINYKYPFVGSHPHSTEPSEHIYCEGKIIPIQFEHEPYEMTVDAEGCSYHFIFGSQINGNFLCIPNWQFGCELAKLDNVSWNFDSITFQNSHFESQDATAIAWALAAASDLIN